ncbi:hypothetical protein [Deinococcus sonorensis]|uniref:Lipoprotein n=2 Tax=Deinococcus sonorensis TaxID=309891 RepID=A0AAU7UDK6_9DEIO
MNSSAFWLPLTLLAVLLAGCTPVYSPATSTPDTQLSCAQIRSELARARSAQAEARANRTLSAQNVAWAAFWLPGAVAGQLSNAQVQQVATQRIGTLTRLSAQKGCG